jgi:dienelactone hydrolase
MKGSVSFACTILVLASAVIITGCGGSSSSTVVPPTITVSVSASGSSVPATGTVPITATVTGDSSGMGVTWTVSCSVSGQCGSVAAAGASSTTTFNATYTAPSKPPASNLAITVKATSVADTSKSASTPITVLAITVSVSTSAMSVQAGPANTVQISATVNNDPSNAGVKFTISPASQVGNLMQQDALDATYNAPTTPPNSDLTVTLTATSVTDTTKSANVSITVPSITISVSPATATVDATGTVPNIVATVGNDPSGKGVTWGVSCSPAPCGSIPPGPTLNGSATTYTAPGTPPSPSDLTVTVTATSVADSVAQSSMTITVKAISVTVTAPNATVLFGQAQPNIVATVNDDPANKGVTWAMQPCSVTDCGNIAPTATASGAAITYTAPGAPPASDISVTLVASSDSNPAQQGSIQLVVPAITVSISPATATIPTGATAALNATPFTPTVNNDSTNKGVSWSITQGTTACSNTCGTVTQVTTASGTATVYAAPAAVPPKSAVTVTATSVADGTKQGSATITLTAGTVKLIPSSLNFGTLKIRSGQPPPTKTLPETITNTGGSTLNITGQATSGNPFSVATPCQGALTTNLASGASCDISVKFAPSTAGSFQGSLTITDNDSTSPQKIALSARACGSFSRCTAAAEFRSAIAENQTTAVPSPTGPNRVGTRVLDLVDRNHSDPYLANGAPRELLVRLWYPANVGENCTLAEYTSPGVWKYLAQIEKVPAPQVKTNSCQDAPITAGKHPIIVFTHGYTGTFTDYTFLFEDLASRGYVVASVNHTYEATAVQFPDGRMATSLVGNHFGNTWQLDDKATWFAVAVRVSDLKFVLNELQRMNSSRSGPFTDKLDLSHVAIAGHSLGGMTALLGMEMEPRFQAALSIDGVIPGSLFGATNKPVLMMFTGRDPWDTDTCRLWGELQGPRVALNFKGTEHLTPSDAVWLAKGAVQAGSGGMEKTVAAIRDYVAAFLDVNLNGSLSDLLLRGTFPEYPDVDVTTRSSSPCGERNSRSSSVAAGTSGSGPRDLLMWP